MEIITRQQAITRQLHRYYTGKPCKRGHLSERYTQMSACLECLHPKIPNADTQARRESRRRIAIANLQMERFKLGIHLEDLDYFTSVVYAFGMLREPALRREDILTRFKPLPRGGTMLLYAFKAFPEDIQALKDIARDLNYANSPELLATIIHAQNNPWAPILKGGKGA